LLFNSSAAEAISAVTVFAVVIAALRSGSSSIVSVRRLSFGCVLLAISPVVTEVHQSLGGSEVFNAGDAVAITGYVFAISGSHRLARLRSVEKRPEVTLDALAITGWLTLAIGCSSIEEVVDQFSGVELYATLSYLPFTIGLIFVTLRVAIGAGDRSAAFVLLIMAISVAFFSEIAFLEAAVGGDGARSVGIVTASLALTLFSAAFIHPSASGLETPRPSSLTRTSRALAGLIGSSIVAVVLVALFVEIRTFEVVILVVLATLIAARAVLIVIERDEWLGLQRDVASYRSSIFDLEEPDELVDQTTAAVEQLLGKKTMVYIDVRSEAEVSELVFGEGDPSGALINEIDGDLWRAMSSGRTQRTESLAKGTSGYSSRLVVPIEAGDGARYVMLVEASPVLSMTEIFHLELIAAGLGSALASASARRFDRLETADRRFRSLVQDSNDVVVLLDPVTLVTKLVSPTVERLLGYSEAECLGVDRLQFVAATETDEMIAALRGNFDVGRSVDLRLLHKNGQTRWFAATVRRLADDDDLDGLIVTLADIQDRKMAELQLANSERRYRGLVETSRDVFCVIDEDLTLTFVSPNVGRMLHVSASSIVGSNVLELIAPESLAAAKALVELPPDGVDGRSVELQLLGGLGQPRWFEVSITSGSHTGDDGWVLNARDIHARHEVQISMERASLHDSLTGLLNRESFQFEVDKQLESMDQHQSVGLIHLDVKDFRIVNESLGLAAGDELLVGVASRIRSGLRSRDVLARLGGDSFAVLSTVESIDDLRDLAARIHTLFEQPFDIRGRQRPVTLVIGMSWTNDRQDAAVTLLEQSAIALRQAKTSESALPVVFEPFMHDVANERFELESDLLPGLAAGEFSVVFQPLLLMETQQVRSVEALLRWTHPERGSVSPASFIPVAEQSGAIVELGRWVLAESCRQLKVWHDHIPGGEGLGVSVNVSVRQLVQEAEFERLMDIILDSGVVPARVTLELTESMMINEVPTVRRGIQDLRSLGVRIAVDDFGTGTAGLSHLRDVPFDILKIDKSYIDPIADDPDAYRLLAGVVELAHSMHATVVAEGIESHEQAALLRRMGCDIGQGFYLGRPMDPAALEGWFAAGRDGTVASQIEAPQTKA